MQKVDKITLNHPQYIGYLFALGATAFWSGNFIVARGLSSEISPLTLAFYRWMVAVLVFSPFAIRQTLKDWRMLKQHLGFLTIAAFLGVSTFNTLIYFAGQTSPAINLSLISISFPVFILIFSRVLNQEKISRKRLIGVGLVFMGVLGVITKGDLKVLTTLHFQEGDAWMLLAAIIFATYSMLMKRKPQGLSVISIQYITFILGLLMLGPFFFSQQPDKLLVKYDSGIWAAIAYVGICASLFAFVLWNKAILLVGAAKSGMVYYLLPLFSGLLAWLILDEALQPTHALSAFLIISGILLSNYQKG
ncbi:DMT family transporter [Persicobacter diffluens]